MCGIFFYLGNYYSTNDLQVYFDQIKGRGPDFTNIIQYQNMIFGFHRLSIVDVTDKANQPFVIDDIHLICNGEIYNHTQLKKENNFSTVSNSDCEIIIHMYQKFGIEKTVKSLDGVFAFVLYDEKKNQIHIARDAFGIRPMFFGTDKQNGMYFCSELKGISKLTTNSHQFKPGSYTTLTPNSYVTNITYTQWYNYNYQINEKFNMSTEDILQNIRDKLISSVKKRLMSDRPIGCLLSGGLDSSLISSIVAREFKQQNLGKLHTFSIGLKGSTDLFYAQKVADFIGSNHHVVEVTEKEFLDAIPEVIYAIESYDTTTVRASTGNYLIAKYIKENTDITVVYNGDGSDEQSGYLYLANAPTPCEFQDECVRLLKEIHLFDVLRSDRSISSIWSLEARTPFLDKEFVQFYMSIDPKLKMYDDRIEKYLLRKAFDEENLLPKEVLWRRKEAFSDGCSSNERSWHSIIQEHINKIISDEDFHKQINNYSHNIPQLKESLYYRNIFEKHYNTHDKSIPHFWMPKWCGEQKDPSARVLDVYDKQYISPSDNNTTEIKQIVKEELLLNNPLLSSKNPTPKHI
tara:strand:+ start:4394 stop:6115 length:1722 start_codon:yes stop_codon:yes gene_type:complete